MPRAGTMVARPNVSGDVRFLLPEVVSKLTSLELVARFIVEGFMIGLHRSPYHGYSVEFTSYRKYAPGDDLRFVDWKVYGRTDRFYVKEFEENTNLSCHMLLDCSGSMSVGDPVSKFRYGQLLTAALSHLMISQGDNVGLVTFNDREVAALPPAGGPTQLHQILAMLDDVEPADITEPDKALLSVAGRVKRRGLIVLVSDLLAEPDDIMQLLKRFRYRGHEVIVFHVLAAEEKDFPFTTQMEFIDAETDERLVTHGGYIREDYLEALEAHVEKIRQGCSDHAIELVELSTADNLGVALSEFLARRQAGQQYLGAT